MRVAHPKPELTADGRRIVYTIWRDDLAEALILPRSEDGNRNSLRQTQEIPSENTTES
jgi:hypothetical protein